jgi:hypothetical protein
MILCVLGLAANVFAGQSSGPRVFVCCLPLAFAVAVVLEQGLRQIARR